MDAAVGLYLAVPLLFTVLALVLASVFVSLRRVKRGHPRQPAGAGAARKSGPGTQAASEAGSEAGREWVPVEEVAAAEQREKRAEEPSPMAEPSPAAAESIPREPPTELHEAEPQEDAGERGAVPRKAEEEDLDSGTGKLVVHSSYSSTSNKHSSYSSPGDKHSGII